MIISTVGSFSWVWDFYWSKQASLFGFEMVKNSKRMYIVADSSRVTQLIIFRIAFCIIFYLTCTTPSLWIVHIETANRKLYRLAENKLNARAAAPPSNHPRLQNSMLNTTASSASLSSSLARLTSNTTPYLLSIDHLECHDKAWYYMDEQRWLDAIQESMFVV